jgi:DNA-binding transcriptional ArsR family regulator
MDDKTHRGRTAAPIEMHQIGPFRSLLYTLAGRSSRDFLIRTAVLQALADSPGPVFSPLDLGEVIPWASARTRSAALRALRQGGWLESDPAAGLILTETGRRVQEVLALLHQGGGASASTGLPVSRMDLASLEIRLAAGLTVEEIAAALRNKSLGELAAAGRAALLPTLPPLPLPVTDAVAQAAEIHVRRRRS